MSSKNSSKRIGNNLGYFCFLIALDYFRNPQGISDAALQQKYKIGEDELIRIKKLLPNIVMDEYATQLSFDETVENMWRLATTLNVDAIPQLKLSFEESTTLLDCLKNLHIDAFVNSFKLGHYLHSDMSSKLTQNTKVDKVFCQNIMLIVLAKIQSKRLSFTYTKKDGTKNTYQVIPLTLHFDRGIWYLQAYDLNTHSNKAFLVSNMIVSSQSIQNGTDVVKTVTVAKDTPFGYAAGKEVTLTIHDKTALEVAILPGLKVLEEKDDSIVATVPYLQTSDWLPLQLIKVNGKITSEDKELNQAIKALAAKKLQELDRALEAFATN